MLGDRPEGVLLVQTIRVPLEGVDAFRRFEAAVLPLLPEHEARLERRLRTSDGRVEIQHRLIPVTRGARPLQD
jgi:hypothetical protein